MVQHTAWDTHPEPLPVDSAPVPEYGRGSSPTCCPPWPPASVSPA